MYYVYVSILNISFLFLGLTFCACGPRSQAVLPEGPPISLAAAAAKSLQSCPTPCDPIDGSPAGSPVPGIVPARTLEWVAISFSHA